jgi:tRNA wybutosine-synthesizing protein 1
MDDPLEIVNSAIDLHTKMIKQMKGVPGNLCPRVTVVGEGPLEL